MTRRRGRGKERPGRSGFLVVDKPSGWTSHDVVDAARRWIGTRRVGHLGTLDPLATGVLPLVVRSATKLVPYLASDDKVYVGTIRLGIETDTLDADGAVVRRHEGAFPDEAAVREGLAAFVGEIEQIPPMYSAVKKQGVPLHKLAREGHEVEREPKRVRVERFELLRYEPPDLDIEVACSGGTYVRALASDLGARLGCGAHLASLRRTASGPFGIDRAATPDELEAAAERGAIEERIMPAVNGLGLPVLRLREGEARDVAHGRELSGTGLRLEPGARVAAVEPGGELLAVLEVRPGPRLKPLRVLTP